MVNVKNASERGEILGYDISKHNKKIEEENEKSRIRAEEKNKKVEERKKKIIEFLKKNEGKCFDEWEIAAKTFGFKGWLQGFFSNEDTKSALYACGKEDNIYSMIKPPTGLGFKGSTDCWYYKSRNI